VADFCSFALDVWTVAGAASRVSPAELGIMADDIAVGFAPPPACGLIARWRLG
jgi:hypothetical protein